MSCLNHTLIALALTLLCTSFAEARQQQYSSPFPPMLQEAIDRSELATNQAHNRTTKRDSTSQSLEKRERHQIPKSNYLSPNGQPNQLNRIPTRDQNRFQPSGGKTSPRPVPKFTKTLTPFPREKIATPAELSRFARPLSPFPRSRPLPQRKLDPTETPNQPATEFGTVMTFPAAPLETLESGVAGNISDTPPTQVIRTSVVGPEILVQDQAEIFEIEVTNYSDQTATNIVIQMGVSDDLTITEFDRRVWLNEANRTVSWQLNELQSGYKDIIRFRAVSTKPGKHEQNLSVGMENTFQGRTSFVANVISHPNTDLINQIAIEK